MANARQTSGPSGGMRMLGAALIVAAATCVVAAEASGPRWRNPRPDASKAQMPPGRPLEAMARLLDRGDRRMVLEFSRLPTSQERARLEAGGVRLLRYLGGNAYFVSASRGHRAETWLKRVGVRGAAPIAAEWKLHPTLARGEPPAYARRAAGAADAEGRTPAGPDAFPPEGLDAVKGLPEPLVEETLALCVQFHPDVDLAGEGFAVVGRHRAIIRSWIVSLNAVEIWLPAAELSSLADEEAVQWIEPPLPPLGPTNDSARQAARVEAIQGPPYWLDGSGIRVMVYDGGTALATHADFGGRLTNRDSSPVSYHPTHVAGTIGGDGLLSAGQYRGMAPSVILECFGFQHDGSPDFLYNNAGDLEADYNQGLNTLGCVLVNNSIGTNIVLNGLPCEMEGDYNLTDALIDAIVRGSLGPPARIIWANGNERQFPSRCGAGYRTIGPPAGAKNHIAVGAINSNDDSMTDFSGWGPTDDGRLRPDVVAPGCQTSGDFGVKSTFDNGGYDVACGTSMAAPAVTGICALMLQDWQLRNPGLPLPRNSTLKALLVHNAQDLGSPGPDYMFGYGAVRARETIDFMRSGAFLEDSIDQGQERRYFVSVAPGLAVLKATLAWDDPPGAVNTVPELVNDLDLELVAPSGGIVSYPWTLDPASPADPARRDQPDRLNNVEQVLVEAPEPGRWTIIVRGYGVADGPQLFSLAASPELRLCAPTGVILTDAGRYGCEGTPGITLIDCDLDLDPQVRDTAEVLVLSTSEPQGETVLLTETADQSGRFVGHADLSSVDAPGVLRVQSGDTLTVAYTDADDGRGGTSVPVTVEVPVDCVSPVISGVQVAALEARQATVAFTTDEPARGRVVCGTTCGGTASEASELRLATTHSLTLTRLQDDTTYFFRVEARDEAGNIRIDDNGGACHQFTTPDVPAHFTQLFTPQSPFDLQLRTILFTPVPTIDYYTASILNTMILPVDPTGSTTLPLIDDGYVEVVLPAGRTFPFYGSSYDRFYVGSNGYITFGAGDGSYIESLADHFRLPRISVCYDDMFPVSGSVSYRIMSDRVAITWMNVREYGGIDPNTFQAVLFDDGRIRLTWILMSAKDGLVGLSRGQGVPPDFLQQDLSALPPGDLRPEPAFGPEPADGETHVPGGGSLRWHPGFGSITHGVYFGLSPQSLVFQGTQTAASFPLPPLDRITQYFWRIDETNFDGTTTGPVWRFTTRPLAADFDADDDVDMADFGFLQACLTGPDVPQTLTACKNAMLDADADVDQADVLLFMGCLRGADVPIDPNCMP